MPLQLIIIILTFVLKALAQPQQPGAPTFAAMVFDFRSLVTFDLVAPSVQTGPVTSYNIRINSTSLNLEICISLICLYCPLQASDRFGERMASCPQGSTVKNYDTFPSPIQLQINDTRILPDTNITFTGQSFNNWGYSNLLSQDVIFSQSSPGAPTLVQVNASFPRGWISVQLNASTRTNGKIYQYVVSLQSTTNKHCGIWSIICRSCSDTSTKNNGDHINECAPTFFQITEVFTLPPRLVFETTQPSYILPNTTYILRAQAVNGWGYGDINTNIYTTPHYSAINSSINRELKSVSCGQSINIGWILDVTLVIILFISH